MRGMPYPEPQPMYNPPPPQNWYGQQQPIPPQPQQPPAQPQQQPYYPQQSLPPGKFGSSFKLT